MAAFVTKELRTSYPAVRSWLSASGLYEVRTQADRKQLLNLPFGQSEKRLNTLFEVLRHWVGVSADVTSKALGNVH